MKIALLADIHSNLEALEACLEHARRNGAERYAVIGDLVGYNANPVEVVDCVRALQEGGAIVVKGNHDAAATGDLTERMNEDATQAALWTTDQLRADQVAYLAGLPLAVRDHDALFVHANAAMPERWGYVSDPARAGASMEAAQATYVFHGHVHDPVLYFRGADQQPQRFDPTPGISIPVARHRRWLAIPGSVGQPRDGRPQACYAMFDRGRSLLTFYRVPYDHHAAARKVRAADLPEALARRLETGV